MGGSHSTISTSDVTNITNSVVQDQATHCAQDSSAINNQSQQNVVISGRGSKVVGTQTNNLNISASCAAQLASNNLITNKLQNAIVAAASTAQQQLTGWLSDQSSNSTSSIVQNFTNNISQKSVQSCLANSNAVNNMSLSNVQVLAGGVDVLSQDNQITKISKCILNSSSSNTGVVGVVNSINQHAANSEESVFAPFVDMVHDISNSLDVSMLGTLGILFVILMIIIGIIWGIGKEIGSHHSSSSILKRSPNLA